MKYSKVCPHCGQKVTAFTHKLNKVIVQCFIRFVERYVEEKRPININKEMGWGHNQLANFRKLKFFKLIAKADDNGFWKPTQAGIRFYCGEEGVMNPVATMGGETLREDHEAWETHSKARRLAFIHDIDDTHYKERQEYKDEVASGFQTSLF